VWLPIVALCALVTLVLAAFYVIELALLLGIWPRKWRSDAPLTFRDVRRRQLVDAGLAISAVWASLALRYANKESSSFIGLFLDSKRMSSPQTLITLIVLTAWMPLVPIVIAVERRRQRSGRKQTISSG
jgi:hypothetical protein